MQQTIALTINGAKQSVTTDPARPLLDVLREELGLMGCKFGCGERHCGACTVLMAGRAIYSCRTPVGSVGRREIETVEGLSEGDTLHPVQEAFLAEGALQCGYCTPGMIMNAVALLREKPQPTAEEIRAAMNRNICRCGTQLRIMSAVARAAGVEGGQKR
jgi:aerobic-type carbon monoxide dehydrogenase small subunit (CoxS/CutS family)